MDTEQTLYTCLSNVRTVFDIGQWLGFKCSVIVTEFFLELQVFLELHVFYRG